jgi:hypothetical protein
MITHIQQSNTMRSRYGRYGYLVKAKRVIEGLIVYNPLNRYGG